MFHGTTFSYHSVWGWAFLEAIAEHAPAVLDDLAGEPYQLVAREGGMLGPMRLALPIRAPTSDALLAWAARWNTPELAQAGLQQCHEWRLTGQIDTSAWSMDHLTPDDVPRQVQALPMVYEFRYAATIDSRTDREAVRRDLLAAFDAETEGHFRYHAAVDDLFKSMNHGTYNAPKKKKARQHLEWLVRFQIKNESKGSIAASLPPDRRRRSDARPTTLPGKTDERTVSRGIDAMARLIGIAPRPTPA